MLKIIELSESALKAFGVKNKVVEGDGNRADATIRNLSKSKKLKNNKFGNLMCIWTIEAMGKLSFLTRDTKKAFNYLRQAFIKAPILQYFDLKSHI